MSEMAYYNDISQSQNGQSPGDAASVGGCGYQHWGVQTVSATLSSGTTFTVNLESEAQYYSVGQCKLDSNAIVPLLIPCLDAGVSTQFPDVPLSALMYVF